MRSKLSTLEKVVRINVKDGSSIGFAGSSGRISVAFAYEVIKQKKKGLTFLSAGTGAHCLDLLVGAGSVTRAELSFIMVNSSNVKRRIETPRSGERRFEIEDYSNLAMTMRFFAGATKLPFIPIRSLRGSDIERLRTFMGKEKMAVIESPFEDRSSVVVLPPCNPDAGVMHAQYADEDGDILALGPAGPDGWLIRAAKRKIVTVEKIVSKSFVRAHKLHTFLPGFMVDVVCEVPYGAHPYGLMGCYSSDVSFQKDYSLKSKTQAGFNVWAKEWIFDVEGRQGYLKKLGRQRVAKITNSKFINGRLFD